jgi:heme A synthase
MKQAQRLAFATAIMTLVLIGVGVLVRATGSGLGCDNWPTCKGVSVIPEHHHAVIEMSHRLVASLVGFMVIGVAVLAWKHYRHAPIVFWTALVTVPLVGFQGVLGAITVVRELPPEIVATHLVTAQIVLAAELIVAFGMLAEDPTRKPLVPERYRPAARRIGLAGLVAMAWLVLVMWVGGYMTESGAATACSGWPLCNGSAIPANDHHEIWHMAHRYLAGSFIIFIATFATFAWKARRELPWARVAAIAAVLLYVVQVFIGALNVWYTFPDALTITHTVIASSVWFTLASTVVIAWYAPLLRREGATSLRPEEVPA